MDWRCSYPDSKIDRLSRGDCAGLRILPREILSSIVIPSMAICSLPQAGMDSILFLTLNH